MKNQVRKYKSQYDTIVIVNKAKNYIEKVN